MHNKKKQMSSIFKGHAAVQKKTTTKNKKNDQGKPRWSLLPMKAVEEIVKVIAAGAIKYSPENWKNTDRLNDVYFSAALRHLTEWQAGSLVYDRDLDERGVRVSHLACAGASILFMIWYELQSDLADNNRALKP